MRNAGCSTYVVLAEHDGMDFVIIRDAYDNDEEYIGYYIDHAGYRHRVLRKSVYGGHITKLMRKLFK